MINPNLLTDSLATEVAMEIILSSCEGAVRERIADSLSKELQDILATYANEAKRTVFFEKLLSSLSSHERKFASMMQGIWEEQRRIIVANLKKMKKAWLQKGKIDELLYPRKQFEKKIASETKILFEPIMEQRAKEELKKIERELRKPKKDKQGVGVVGAFDVENAEVQKWLDSYTPKFSKKLEKVSTDKLRSELTEGIKEGEGIPKLTKRVNLTYANWNKVRSETIARSEAMRASNRGAIESYRQSGVVEKKIWITFHDKRTCYSCADLDGKIISLEDNYFNLGDADEIIERGGRTYTFKNDYEDIGSPPRHARCRCTIAASFEDMEREIKPARIDFHKNLTRKEKKLIKEWSEVEYKNIRSWIGMTPHERERFLAFYRYDQHKQAWLTQQIKNAEMLESIFAKYKDGMRAKALYRSIYNIKDDLYQALKKYKPGEIIEIDRSITSWSYDKKILNKFTHEGENNIHFILKKGRTTLQELDIENYSKYAFEKEVLVYEKEMKVIKIEEVITSVPDHPGLKTKILKIYIEEKGG